MKAKANGGISEKAECVETKAIGKAAENGSNGGEKA